MKKIVSTALAGVVALGLSTISTQVLADNHKEKCYGVVKAAKNDCGTSKHSCAGQASKDSDAAEWVYLPTGTCAKLTNGSTTSSEATEKKES